jgi:hypothetical protein
MRYEKASLSEQDLKSLDDWGFKNGESFTKELLD